MVKTSYSKAGGVGANPGQGAKISRAWKPKKKKIRSNSVTVNKNFTNYSHQKKNLKKKKNYAKS